MLHFIAERLKQSTKDSLMFADCCNSVKVHFSPDQDPPPYLQKLITGWGSAAWYSRSNFRSYNSSMSMTSMTANWQERCLGTFCLDPTIMLRGRVYHSIKAFITPGRLVQTYSSLYTHATDFSKRSSIRSQNCD